MSCVFEVEHCPKVCIWIRLGDLVQRRVVLVDNLVYWRDDSCVFYCPAEISGSFTSDDVGCFAFGDGGEGSARLVGSLIGREKLGDA